MAAGDLCSISREVKYEWKIKESLLLSHETGKKYISPEFSFSDLFWRIWIYPNGQTSNKSEGWIGLYLSKVSGDIAVKVNCSFSMKTVDGKSVFDETTTTIFEKNNSGWGYSKVISRSELIERKSELLPSGVLTVTCTLKNGEASAGKQVTCVDAFVQTDKETGKDDACLDAFSQTDQETDVPKLQQHLKEILVTGNVSDVVLKVGDQELKSHWSILAARSPVFLAMMTHETKEKNTGVVDIPEIDPNTFSVFLNYLYTGSMGSVTSENVAKLYTAADKYQVDVLKKSCVDFMLNNFSVDSFCDFLALSLLYVEKELTDACSQYFIENALSIVLTPKWQAFLIGNPVAGNELLIKVLQFKK